jgi:hypothetical protein
MSMFGFRHFLIQDKFNIPVYDSYVLYIACSRRPVKPEDQGFYPGCLKLVLPKIDILISLHIEVLFLKLLVVKVSIYMF